MVEQQCNGMLFGCMGQYIINVVCISHVVMILQTRVEILHALTFKNDKGIYVKTAKVRKLAWRGHCRVVCCAESFSPE